MKDITRIKDVKMYLDTSVIGSIFKPEVKDLCRLFSYEAGDLICEKHGDIQYLLFLVKGEVKVFTMLESGKVYLLRIEHAISVYGDLEVLFDEAYSANVEALNQCQCLGIPIGYIRRECLDSPEFLKYIISSLSTRLERITDMSTSNLLQSLKPKLASYLLAFRIDSNKVVAMTVTYTEVAEHLGTTYRHLSRVLKEMEEEGLIMKKGRIIELLELDILEALAGDTYRY